MIHKRHFSQPTCLTPAEAAGLAREVLESARQALRDTPGPPRSGPQRTIERRVTWGRVTWRRWLLPAAIGRLARYPEYSTITACLLVCVGGIVRQRLF